MTVGGGLRRLLAGAAAVVAVATVTASALAQGPTDVATDLATIDVASVNEAVAAELGDPRYRLGRRPWSERIGVFLDQAWARFLDWAFDMSRYVGGPVPLALIVAGVIVASAVAVTTNLGGRRARTIDERLRREHRESRGLDPGELERQARHAEDEGDHALAFRLMFRSGLLRLHDRGVIDLRPGTTSDRLTTQLGSDTFTRLVGRFDDIVYGGREATAADPASVRLFLDEILGRARA